jgi:hypothetical protein
MAHDAIFAVVAAGCWLAALHRARHLRRPGAGLAVGALVTALSALGTATLIQIPDVAVRLDRLTATPTGGKLIAHCCVLIAAYAAQTVLVLTLTPARSLAIRRVRRRLLVLLSILTVLVLLVLLAPTGQEPMRAVDGVPRPTVPGAVYVALYCGYLGIANVDICRMGFRYARLADRAFLRLGMLSIAFGTAIGTGYTAGKALLVAGRLAGVESTAVERFVVGPVVLIAVTLTAVGSVLPSLSRWRPLQRPVRWLVRFSTYRALRPLWARLVDSVQVPQLTTSSWLRATTSGLSLQFLLQRRVTEISDGLLQLRPHLDPRPGIVAGRLAERAGLAAGEREAVMTAAGIAAALRARADGVTPAEPDATASPQFSDLDSKAWWLQQVAWAIRHSGIVEEAVRAGAASAVPDGART